MHASLSKVCCCLVRRKKKNKKTEAYPGSRRLEWSLSSFVKMRTSLLSWFTYAFASLFVMLGGEFSSQVSISSLSSKLWGHATIHPLFTMQESLQNSSFGNARSILGRVIYLSEKKFFANLIFRWRIWFIENDQYNWKSATVAVEPLLSTFGSDDIFRTRDSSGTPFSRPSLILPMYRPIWD